MDVKSSNPAPIIECVRTRFRITSWPPVDGKYAWFDAADSDVIRQVLHKERFDLAMTWAGFGECSEGVQVAAALREAGLLHEPPLESKYYTEGLKKMRKDSDES